VNGYKVIENVSVSDAGIFSLDNAVVHLADAETMTGQKTFSAGLKTDAIDEETDDTGVTVDGVLLKDGGADLSGTLTVNLIQEHTLDNGIDIEGVDIKDGNVYGGYLSASLGVYADTIDEYTSDTGITAEGVLLKDSTVYTDTIGDNGAGYITMYDRIKTCTNTENTAFGIGTGSSITGLNNTLFGNSAGRSLTSGANNLFFGYNAGYSVATHDENVALGGYALNSLNAGNGNLALGYQSMQNTITSYGSVAIGGRAGRNIGSYSVAIGFNAGENETGTNKLYIANSNTTTPLIYGEFNNNIVKINDTVYVDNITEYTASNGITLGDGGTTDYMSIANDGSVTLYGDARYDCTIQIPVGAVLAPGASAASLVSRGLNGAWEYGNNLVRQTSATVILRENMDRTVAPTLRVFWESPTTSATCKWQLDYIYRKANEDMSTTSGTTVSVDGTSSATANGLVYTDFTLATPDSDDIEIVMRLTRNGDAAGDTLGDSAYTHGWKIMYKANKL